MTNQTLTGIAFTLTGEQVKLIQAAIKGLKHSKKERQSEVIQNVRFTSNAYQVTFEAIDQNNHVSITFPCEQEIEGSMTMNKSVIKDLKLNKNDDVTFEAIEGKVKISINGLTTLQPMEFEMAQRANYENGETFNLNSNYVKSLSNALKFVSQSETRPILQGICHENCDIVCTDSHQLYKMEVIHTLKDGKITVHSSTAKLVCDLMKNKSEILMSVSSNEKYVRYEAFNIVITGRIIDGNYPNTKNMIPNYFKTELNLNEKQVKQLVQTIKSKLQYTSKLNNPFKFELSNNTLTVKSLKAIATKVGDKMHYESVETSATVIENVNISGDDLEITFNGKNVLTALDQQKGEALAFQFTGKVSPFMIIGDKIKDQYLYSPIRIN